MTTTATITYRKTRQGEWVAFGPADAVKVGAVTVTKKDGTTKTERVERVGRPFEANGRQMVYGYLAPRSTQRPVNRWQDEDHEDCLSFAGCLLGSPRCPYHRT